MENTTGSMFPMIRVAGAPTERGRAYGVQARTLIHRSISGYEQAFAHYAGWDWQTVRRHATRFARCIEDFSPRSMAEMRGIADGAGVDLEDILALNTRSEIMFAARNHAGRLRPGLHECTAFAVQPARSRTQTTIVGQNWDWLLHARQTTTLLMVIRDDGPSFITLVEAGLLAKVGMNADGVGLCTNTLISDGDEGRIGVPYHVLLRGVLDSTTGAAAAALVTEADRANSANYLIVDDTGFATDLETTPRAGGVQRLTSENGQITHANHFRARDLTGDDMYLANKSHTTTRLRNVTRSLAAVDELTVDHLKSALADHRDQPSSVCQHPDMGVHPRERTATIAGVIMDVARGAVHVAAGSPCQAEWQTLELSARARKWAH